jgi:hypothetical protein
MKEDGSTIKPLTNKRDFFDNSSDKSAYKCLPITSASVVGWGVSFPEDISFIWDGETDNFPDHVKILSGKKYVEASTNKTLILYSGFAIETDENITTLITPVPNQFTDEWATVSLALSTSFYRSMINFGIVVLKANKVITIKAGTLIANILPVSLSELNNSEVEVYDWQMRDSSVYNDEYSNVIKENSKLRNVLSNFYRNAVNHKKEKIGNHEVKFLNLSVTQGNREVTQNV